MRKLLFLLLVLPLWVQAQFPKTIEITRDTSEAASVNGRMAISSPGKFGWDGTLVGKDNLGASYLMTTARFESCSKLRQMMYLRSDVTYRLEEAGKEGDFRADPNDTTTLDDGSMTLVTLNGKRLKRVYNGPIYPKWFGAKGDSVSNDQAALGKMLKWINDGNRMGTIIDLAQGKFRFDSLTFPRVRNCKIVNGSLLGTLSVGSKIVADRQFEYYLEIQGVRFDLSMHEDRTGRNGLVFSNAYSVNVNHCGFKGVSNAVYVYPHNVFQHCARITIDNCNTEQDKRKLPNDQSIDRFVFVDNSAKNNPGYAGMVMGMGDLTVTNCGDIHARIHHILAYGLDGSIIAGNTFFFPGGFYRSQIKEQNIHIAVSNWVSIENTQVFEAGYEGILLENSSAYAIHDCRVSWPGQRDATRGYGILATGPGFPDVNFTQGVISDVIVRIPTRAGVWIGSGANVVSVSNVSTLSAGNPSFYYGDGTKPMGETAVPAINQALVSAGGWDVNTKRVIFNGNTCDNKDFIFPVNPAATEYERNRHKNNFSLTGIANEQTKLVTVIASNRIDVSNAQHVFMNVSGGGSIEGFDGPVPGQMMTIENGSVPFEIVNNSFIRLAGDVNTTVPYKEKITFMRRVGYWMEVSRTYPLPGLFNQYAYVATDASYTVPQINADVYLPPLTANRVVSLPTGVNAKYVTLYNRNNTAFTWTTNQVLYYSDASTTQTVPSNSVMRLVFLNGVWRIASVFRGTYYTQAEADAANRFLSPRQISDIRSIGNANELFYSTATPINTSVNTYVAGLQVARDKNALFKNLLYTNGQRWFAQHQINGTWGNEYGLETKWQFVTKSVSEAFLPGISNQTVDLPVAGVGLTLGVDASTPQGTVVVFRNSSPGTVSVTPNTVTIDGQTGLSGIVAMPAGGYFWMQYQGNNAWKIIIRSWDQYTKTESDARYLQGTRAAASTDAAAAVSAAYVQSEVQAILNELRDLKAKMRAANLLSN